MGTRQCSTGKARWTTRSAAETRLAEIRTQPLNGLYEPTSAYHCHKCNGYHLTSRPRKTWGKTKTPRGRRYR